MSTKLIMNKAIALEDMVKEGRTDEMPDGIKELEEEFEKHLDLKRSAAYPF